MIDYNKQAKAIFEQNKAIGWWDDPDRCIFQTLQLVSTEFAEATEGERKDLMDDHLPHRKMGEVELADAFIRVLDLGGRYGWLHTGLDWAHPGVMDVDSIAGKHFMLNVALVDFGAMLKLLDQSGRDAKRLINQKYAVLINSIVLVAEFQDYDIESAMTEKLTYNLTRADHKRENRTKEGGKSF